jgi:signal transduction histidine kinase
VGLASMSERAEMLGGRLTAGPNAAGGVVTARIPLTPA